MTFIGLYCKMPPFDIMFLFFIFIYLLFIFLNYGRKAMYGDIRGFLQYLLHVPPKIAVYFSREIGMTRKYFSFWFEDQLYQIVKNHYFSCV
jgi:hypothetical protein